MRTFLDRLFRRREREPVPLVLYSRPGCHLCEVMKAEIARARVSRAYRLEERDIDRDEKLAELWGKSIPVLEIGGRLAFKVKLSASEFERKFERMAEEWARAKALGGALSELQEER